jgi:hypothetical protein
MKSETAAHTPGKWELWTSNSWRRIGAANSGGHFVVCEPVTQPDGHPDLHFPNGGENGPDAQLLLRAPELLSENERLRAALEKKEWALNLALAALVNPQMMDIEGVTETVRAALEGK